MFKPVLMDVAKEMGVPVNDINVDYDASFTEKFSVNSIPTLIITDNQGNVLYRNTGVMSRDQIKNAFSHYKQ
jgi:thioredoxin-related protein